MFAYAAILVVFFESHSAYGLVENRIQSSLRGGVAPSFAIDARVANLDHRSVPARSKNSSKSAELNLTLNDRTTPYVSSFDSVENSSETLNTTEIVLNAELSEDGYHEVLALRDNDAMALYVQRILSRYHGRIVVEAEFWGILPYISGDRGNSSFDVLINMFARANWLFGFQDASKVSLDENGYQEIASMKNDHQMRAFMRRVIEDHGGSIQKDKQPFFSVVPWYSGTSATQSYDALVKELSTSPWMSGFQNNARQPCDPKALLKASSDLSFFEWPEEDGRPRPDELLFIGVFSDPRNFERRREIRESWMMDRIFHKGDDRPKVKARFMMGQIWEEEWGEDFLDLRFQIEEENRMYGDIVELPVHDNPGNRTEKSIAFFKWYSDTYCCVWERHHYAMSIKEDTWPNLNLILNFLKENLDDPSQKKYIGGMKWHRPVIRRGEAKEIAPLQSFSKSNYPVYALGGGFIVNMELARGLSDIISQRGITFLRDPDTTIGNFLYREDHVTISVEYYDVNVNDQSCDDNSYFLMGVSIGKMRCMWEKRVKAASDDGANPNEHICCEDSNFS